MKTLKQYINESLRGEELFLSTLKDNKFTKEQLVGMLMNMDMNTIKSVSDKLKQEYDDSYFAYEPNKDDFLKTSNKESICNKISDFILKTICQ